MNNFKEHLLKGGNVTLSGTAFQAVDKSCLPATRLPENALTMLFIKSSGERKKKVVPCHSELGGAVIFLRKVVILWQCVAVPEIGQ